MFGYRTPLRKATDTHGSPNDDEGAGPSTAPTQPSNVRKSIGEWEASKNTQKSPNPPHKTILPAQLKLKIKTAPIEPKPPARRMSAEAPNISPKQKREYPDRVSEARACIRKAKTALGESRNLRADIKTDVTQAVERLYQLVKEAENTKSSSRTTDIKEIDGIQTEQAVQSTKDEPTELMKQLMANLQQHNQALEECQQHTRALSERLQQAPRYVAGQGPTFAEIAAGPKQHIREPLHSVVVSSVNEQDTGEEVIEKLRTAVDARNEGTRVERLRKARDQKVVVGFKTREELTRVTDRIRKVGTLVVEEVKNKDPLIIVKDVLSCHTDAEVTQALQRQNAHLIGDIPADDLRLGVKYRRRTRNPHMCHIIMQVSPTAWQRLTMAGRVHIDLQRVRVLDQSPLVQCTRCLRFGHSRKLCTQPADLCIHCGDPHLQADCPSRLAAEVPKCHNCLLAKLENTDHNAFANECPMRAKWDALARLSVAYC